MDNNDKPQSAYAEAGRVVRLCESLDFQGIIQHRPKAIEALQNAVKVLNLRLPRSGFEVGAEPSSMHESIVDSVAAPDATAVHSPEKEKAELQERRRQLVGAISHGGLGDRLGKMYSSLADVRLQPFREAPHKMGLPTFDLVLAPDFSPEAGLHVILIAAQEIVSCVLPNADANRPWQVRQRARYSNADELVDIVSLMSAGFPIE